MIRRVLIFAVLLALGAVHVIALDRAGREQRYEQTDDGAGFVIPAPYLKIVSLDYDGLTSDFLFLRSLVFIGGRLQTDLQLKLPKREWVRFYQMLDASAEIDPYFRDPYYLANGYLPWYAGMARETNDLLRTGSDAMTWDWTFPFFIGFNYFYFLNDDGKASEYLMEASRRPGASPTIGSLASRLAYKENKTENAILFLEEVLRRTEDRSLRKQYKVRLASLRNVLFLERAIKKYKKKFGKQPATLDALVEKNLIAAVPRDPGGGVYFIGVDGKIQSTGGIALFRKLP